MTELTERALEDCLAKLMAVEERMSMMPTHLYLPPKLSRSMAKMLGYVTGRHILRGSMRKRKKGRMAGIRPHSSGPVLHSNHDDAIDNMLIYGVGMYRWGSRAVNP